MKQLAIAVAVVTSGVAHAAPGDRLNPEQWLTSSAARIFALKGRLHGNIGITDENAGRIGETHEVSRVGKTCTFILRERNGPVLEEIDFSRLSGDYTTQRRGSYVLLQAPGRKGASCEIKDGSKGCRTGLEMLLMVYGNPSEMQLAMRALNYITGKCPSAQLEF